MPKDSSKNSKKVGVFKDNALLNVTTHSITISTLYPSSILASRLVVVAAFIGARDLTSAVEQLSAFFFRRRDIELYIEEVSLYPRLYEALNLIFSALGYLRNIRTLPFDVPSNVDMNILVIRGAYSAIQDIWLDRVLAAFSQAAGRNPDNEELAPYLEQAYQDALRGIVTRDELRFDLVHALSRTAFSVTDLVVNTSMPEDDASGSSAIEVPNEVVAAEDLSGSSDQESAPTDYTVLENSTTEVELSVDLLRSQLQAFANSISGTLSFDVTTMIGGLQRVYDLTDAENYNDAITAFVMVMTRMLAVASVSDNVRIIFHTITYTYQVLTALMTADDLERLRLEYSFYLPLSGLIFDEESDAASVIFDTLTSLTTELSSLSLSTDAGNGLAGMLIDFAVQMTSSDFDEAAATLSSVVDGFASLSSDDQATLATYVVRALYLARSIFSAQEAATVTIGALEEIFVDWSAVVAAEIETSSIDSLLETVSDGPVSETALLSSVTPEVPYMQLWDDLHQLFDNFDSSSANGSFFVSRIYLYRAAQVLLLGQFESAINYFALAIFAASNLEIQNGDNDSLIFAIERFRSVLVSLFSNLDVTDDYPQMLQVEANYTSLRANYDGLSSMGESTTLLESFPNISSLLPSSSLSLVIISQIENDGLSETETGQRLVVILYNLNNVLSMIDSGDYDTALEIFSQTLEIGFSRNLEELQVIALGTFINVWAVLGSALSSLEDLSVSIQTRFNSTSQTLFSYITQSFSYEPEVLGQSTPDVAVSNNRAAQQRDQEQMEEELSTDISISEYILQNVGILRDAGASLDLISGAEIAALASRLIDEGHYVRGITLLQGVVSDLDEDVMQQPSFGLLWFSIVGLYARLYTQYERGAFPSEVPESYLQSTSSIVINYRSVREVMEELISDVNAISDRASSYANGVAIESDELSDIVEESDEESADSFGPEGEVSISQDAVNDADTDLCDLCHDELRNLRL